MSLWRQLTRGLRAMGTTRTDRDIRDEVAHYVDQSAAAHRARGLSPDDALRAAHIEVGGVTNMRERIRGYGWENLVDTTMTDLRYAARRLRAAPAFTTITVLTLALGVGATTAIFSAVNQILFESLPYPDAGRLVAILETYGDGGQSPGTFGMYREFTRRARSFDAIAVLKPWKPAMTGDGQPERFEGQRVSAGYFGVLGIHPAMGRDFLESEDVLNGPNVVVVSDAFWRRRLNGDSGVIGRRMRLNDTEYSVIGVMPTGFDNVLSPAAELWAPLQYDMSLGSAWGHHLRTVARVRGGVSLEQAGREVGDMGRAVLADFRPDTYDPKTGFAVASLGGEITRGIKPALFAILGAVALVLVIACVNVTNLLLARGAQRNGEFALRTALGAGRNRMIRQLLTESLLLAAIGGVVGMGVAALGVRALVALSPPGLPRVDAIHVDATVFVFGLVITTVIGVVFGMIPALQAARNDPNGALQEVSQRATGGHRRTRNALVIAEVAVALVLLVSSGLLLRSLERLFAVPVGFDGKHLLTMQIQLVGRRYSDAAATYRFFDQALAGVRRVPGVRAAALTTELPLSGDLDSYGVHFSATATQAKQTYSVYRYAVSPGYVEAMGIPVLRGRAIDEHQRATGSRGVLISQSLARERFGAADPIGAELNIGPAIGAPFTVVGVVGDVKQLSLALSDGDAVYMDANQSWYASSVMSLVVRTTGDAAAMTPAVRQAVWSVDRDQPIARVSTMENLIAASAAERRFALILFEAFALAALVLAAAGIYGVLSGSVTERTREIGVRSALGASRNSILSLIVRQGMTLTMVGAAIGLIGATAATRAIAAMLFGVSRFDVPTYLGVVALLGVVSLIACTAPAWRAAQVDPARTLRE